MRDRSHQAVDLEEGHQSLAQVETHNKNSKEQTTKGVPY